MKIAINSLPLKSGHTGRGIGFYTKNLIKHLKLKDGLDIQEFSQISEVNNADIVHYPFFDLFYPTLPLRKKYPTVVTIHDVTPLVFSEHYPPGIKGKVNLLRQKMALKNVKAVITDSEASKRDISHYLSVSSDKIHVIYLAPLNHFQLVKDKERLRLVRKKYNLPEKFVLFTGNVNWNKNLLNISKACLEAKIDLVLIGKSFESKENLSHAEMKSYALFLEKYSHLPAIHVLGFVPDDDLAAITNLAQVQLLPSYYEGFGLPILEAQACGIPVITGNISSMPEIAGEGAILVDPQNVKQIAEAILKVMENQEFKKDLIDQGFENLKRFSWEKLAEETIQVYQKINLT